MADVHVVITNKGGFDDIIVMPEQLPVLDDDFIFWHVSSDHPEVEEVEIAFDNSDAKFFEFKDVSGKTKEEPIYRKTLTSRKEPEPKSGLRMTKSALISGRAPMFDKLRKPNKYTVRALDGSGAEIVSEDPTIITTRPRP